MKKDIRATKVIQGLENVIRSITSNNNTVKIVIHSFYPFSWCYVPAFPAYLGPKMGGLNSLGTGV